jgi:ABC-type phosphate/phosphonate transport system substrate-binding protein
VTPACKAAWQTLIGWALQKAEIDARYEDHDPPQLLSDLWSRADLACVQMCGLPYSLREPQATILAAPVPTAPGYDGEPIYWSDIAVRADSQFETLEDTFGTRAGYTLKDSQSGYFAFHHHLLTRYPNRPHLYQSVTGGLMNPRGVIKALAEKRIDVGPLDSYVHDLLKANDPEFARQVRVIQRTDPTPMPPLVATAALDGPTVERLRTAFVTAHTERALDGARKTLLIDRFVVTQPSVYRVQRERAEAVERSGETW